MIKFRCPGCDQKLGVPDEYAGKRVRCSKCGQPCQVPAAASVSQPPAQPVAAAAPMRPSAPVQQKPSAPAPRPQAPPPPQPASISASEQANPFAGLQFDETGPNSQALAAARQERYKQSAKVSRSKSSAKPDKPAAGRFSGAGAAMGAAKIPLSLAVSLAFMIGVCVLWTVLASLTGLIFVYVAVGVAAAGAYGLVMFTEKRNVGLGLLSILMAIFGITIGKAMIAKWAVAPQLKEMLQSEEFQGEPDTPFVQLSQEEKDDLLIDESTIYHMAAMDLWNKGDFDETVTKSLILNNISLQFAEIFAEEDDQQEAAEEEDAYPTPSEYQYEHQSVCSLVEQWTPQDIQQAFENHYDSYQSHLSDWVMNSSLVQGLGAIVAFIGAFSLWDLIIIPVSLITAYKIGVGSNA